MNVTKYEIDFLDVEDADAILIHFYDDQNNSYVVAIDAGRYSDGDKVSTFIKDHYNTNIINYAIVSHCDDDHYGGFIKLLEEQKSNVDYRIRIERFLINDPGLFAKADNYKYYRLDSNVRDKAREVYDTRDDKNLLEMIRNMKIPHNNAFSLGGDFCSFYEGVFEILAPTKIYFQSLVPGFRNDLEPYDADTDDPDDTQIVSGQCLSQKLDKYKDDTSSHNKSSIVVLFKPDQFERFVFMGDASRESFNKMLSVDRNKIRNITLLKVPHHGSHHNINSSIINWINPKIAIISAKSRDKYFSTRVKFALKKKNVLVYSTNVNGSLWYHYGIDGRENEYAPATPVE